MCSVGGGGKVERVILVCFFSSVRGGLRAGLHDQTDKEDSGEGWLLWPVPWHFAQFHESDSCCQHQLCGVRVHEDWARHFKVRCMCACIGGCSQGWRVVGEGVCVCWGNTVGKLHEPKRISKAPEWN